MGKKITITDTRGKDVELTREQASDDWGYNDGGRINVGIYRFDRARFWWLVNAMLDLALEIMWINAETRKSIDELLSHHNWDPE